MTKIIDRTGKGAAISQAEYDANLSSLHGINQSVTGTTHTVDNTDQGDTLECTNAGTCTVTLTAIATINGNIDTDDFKVTILAATASGGVTITRSSTDVIGVDADTSISLVAGQAVTLQTDSSNGVWNIISSIGYSYNIGVANVRLNTKVIDIGDWNMDSTSSKAVAHGLTLSTIRTIKVGIRDDNGLLLYDLSTEIYANTANVNMSRDTGGSFDNGNYDSTSYNRGWITIQYTD